MFLDGKNRIGFSGGIKHRLSIERLDAVNAQNASAYVLFAQNLSNSQSNTKAASGDKHRQIITLSHLNCSADSEIYIGAMDSWFTGAAQPKIAGAVVGYDCP